MESKHWDPNVYNIKPLSGKGLMHMVKWWKLFDLQKSQGDNLLNQAPDTNLAIMPTKIIPENKTPQISHPYGTWSKTKVNSTTLQSSSEDETKVNSTVLKSSCEDGGSSGVIRNLFNCIPTKLQQ